MHVFASVHGICYHCATILLPLLGELYAGIEVPWYSARQSDYGVQVTGAMRFAALHSHMAVWKVDLDVGPGDDWKKNSVYLMEVIPDPARPGANTLKK